MPLLARSEDIREKDVLDVCAEYTLYTVYVLSTWRREQVIPETAEREEPEEWNYSLSAKSDVRLLAEANRYARNVDKKSERTAVFVRFKKKNETSDTRRRIERKVSILEMKYQITFPRRQLRFVCNSYPRR